MKKSEGKRRGGERRESGEVGEKRASFQPPLPVTNGGQLTERDLAALRWLIEQRAATATQVTTLLGYLGTGPITDRRGSMVMARWEELGLVERTHIWHRRPAVVWPTHSCATMFGRSRWRRPAIGTLNHTLHASQVRLQVCRPGSGRGWRTEQELRATLPGGTRVPDGAIIEIDGGLTAVEVELTSHGRMRVREAMISLLAVRNGDEDFFHHVLYLCSPEVMTQVNAVRADLPSALQCRAVVLPCPSL